MTQACLIDDMLLCLSSRTPIKLTFSRDPSNFSTYSQDAHHQSILSASLDNLELCFDALDVVRTNWTMFLLMFTCGNACARSATPSFRCTLESLQDGANSSVTAKRMHFWTTCLCRLHSYSYVEALQKCISYYRYFLRLDLLDQSPKHQEMC